MKEKSILKGEELERIDNELFGSLDPEDESWIVGGSTITSTAMATYSPGGPDGIVDIDYWEFEAQ
jgi:hypothetical protein